MSADVGVRRYSGRVLVTMSAVIIGLAATTTWYFARRAASVGRAGADRGRASSATTVRLESVVANLGAGFGAPAAAAPPGVDGLHSGRLQPGSKLDFGAGHRRAIVAPPPSRWEVQVLVPAGAILRFGIGVERLRSVAGVDRGVRFAVRVDGRETFAQVLEPVGRRIDRRWFDARIDLGVARRRDVRLAFETTAVGPGDRVGGAAGWSHVRIVHETERDRQRASVEAPNVIVALVDTLRADRLGCYGANPSPSPTLDGFAAEGIVVADAVAQSSWTLPSVASLLTGRHPRHHGVVGARFRRGDRDDGDPVDRGLADPTFLADALPTLAETAQAAGITTMAVSTNPLVSRDTNLAQGFETFITLEKEREHEPPGASEVNRVFLDWVQNNVQYRFLAYLHYMDVHGPYKPPPAYRPPPPPDAHEAVVAGEIDRVQRALLSPGARGISAAELAHLRALYDGQIRHWDEEFGRLLAGLAAAGVRGSTIVIVTADHGEGFLEHGHLKHGVTLYDELLRVPLVIQGPGVRRGRLDVLGQGIDLFPTVAGLLGLGVPEGLLGQNLLATPTDRRAISETRWGFGPEGGTDLVAMRSRAWKLVYAPATGRFAFYDLVLDPGEAVDRMRERADATALARELVAWERTPPLAPSSNGAAAGIEDALRALGYLE